MPTGPELAYFEQEHNLTHPIWIDLDAWAERINDNGGKCPCFPQRTCPCAESLDEIAKAEDPKFKTCSCQIFCDQEHLDYLNEIEKIRIEETELIDPKTIKDEKIKTLIESINTAIYHLKNNQPMEAANVLDIEKERHQDCDACKGYLEENIQRTLMIASACSVDEEVCIVEVRRAITRLNDIARFYKQVDEASETSQPPILQKANKKRPTGDAHHQCVREAMAELKEMTTNQHIKLVASTLFCAKKANSLEEALEMSMMKGGKLDG